MPSDLAVTNSDRSYRLLRKLYVSLPIADHVSRLMFDFTVMEQDIVYYWLQNYIQKEIIDLMGITGYRVEVTIAKFKALGKAELRAISRG